MSETDFETGDTIRSKCGRARITYRPDWSPSRPWASYRNGSAEKHYVTAKQGIEDLSRNYGFRFDTKNITFKREQAIPAPEGGW